MLVFILDKEQGGSARQIRQVASGPPGIQQRQSHNSMIPQISQAPGVIQLVLAFLEALKSNGFTGDVTTTYADRLT